MGLLLLASLMSWTIIFRKRSLLSKAHDEAENFESSFWKGGDLTALYRQIEGRGGATGMSSIFEFGFPRVRASQAERHSRRTSC